MWGALRGPYTISERTMKPLENEVFPESLNCEPVASYMLAFYLTFSAY